MPLSTIANATVENYKTVLIKSEKEPVFIFIGDATNNEHSLTPYSRKYNSAITDSAALAEGLSKENYPTLSLPLTNITDWDPSTQALAKRAIADLYRAAGAGHPLIQSAEDIKYLGTSSYQKLSTNQELAHYFHKELLTLYFYLQPNFEGNIDPEFESAFRNGEEIAQNGSTWIKKPENTNVEETSSVQRIEDDSMLMDALALAIVVAILSALIFCLFVVALMAQAPLLAGILGGIVMLGVSTIIAIPCTILEGTSSSNIVTNDTFFSKKPSLQPSQDDYPQLVELGDYPQ